jgi:4-aminobutyrate--pyruvate transaminase
VIAILQEKGVLCRNVADGITFCPPLIITEKQVDALVDILSSALDQAKTELSDQLAR